MIYLPRWFKIYLKFGIARTSELFELMFISFLPILYHLNYFSRFFDQSIYDQDRSRCDAEERSLEWMLTYFERRAREVYDDKAHRRTLGIPTPDTQQQKLLESAISLGGMGEEGGDYGGVGHLPNELRNADASAMNDDDDNKPVIEVDAGTTAVVVLLTPKWIVCANAGDSRAVYSRSGHRSVPLSYDHKPSDEAEERRIRNAGGYVAGGRVEADLAVSRGLGDFRFKELNVVASGACGERREVGKGGASLRGGVDDAPMMRPSDQKVSPFPDIIVQNRDPKEDEFVVLACDGIWDVQTNQDCVKMVAKIFADGESDMGLVCEEVRSSRILCNFICDFCHLLRIHYFSLDTRPMSDEGKQG